MNTAKSRQLASNLRPRSETLHAYLNTHHYTSNSSDSIHRYKINGGVHCYSVARNLTPSSSQVSPAMTAACHTHSLVTT